MPTATQLAAASQALAAYDAALSADLSTRMTLAQHLDAVQDVRALQLLWLLSYDTEPSVVLAAAQSAVRRCAREGSEICAAGLRFFLRAADPPASVLARNALMARWPLAALTKASTAYKLATVAAATAQLGHPKADPGHALLLRTLAEDPNGEVAQAAGAALMTLER